jgi:hypothetical protein
MSFEATDAGATTTFKIFITIPPHYTIEQALSAIAKTFNKGKPSATVYKMCYSFMPDTKTAKLFMTDLAGLAPAVMTTITAVDDGFWELFNVQPADRAKYLAVPAPGVSMTNSWEFPNVWDRKDICVHASFVNNAAFHFLGRHGDFFPTPSKIYYQNFTGNDFEVYLTRDGVNPLELPFQDFAIELSFLIDRNHYQE